MALRSGPSLSGIRFSRVFIVDLCFLFVCGLVVQGYEYLVRNQGVGGSNPPQSTIGVRWWWFCAFFISTARDNAEKKSFASCFCCLLLLFAFVFAVFDRVDCFCGGWFLWCGLVLLVKFI